MNTHPMTEARLAEIEARAAKATEGPWERSEDGLGTPCVVARRNGYGNVLFDECGDYATSDDYDFIAAARADVPDLVAEVRRLRGMLREALLLMDGECGTDHQTDEHADLYRRIQEATK